MIKLFCDLVGLKDVIFSYKECGVCNHATHISAFKISAAFFTL